MPAACTLSRQSSLAKLIRFIQIQDSSIFLINELFKMAFIKIHSI